MGPISAEIEVDAPRERAFETIGDLARRPSFTDHLLTDFHLTRIEPRGVGAGARFRFRHWPRSFWADTTIVEVEAPHRIVERGRGGRDNRIPTRTVWELQGGSGSLTRIRVSFWTEPSSPVDRALEKLSGAAPRQERAWREALRRLRDLLESDGPAEPGLALAGGNPHATGIP
ncbi:MAG TPA: SRPBCC family protein [Solirubrobacterales bacterium]